jgi:hypothetical protein
VNPTQPRARRRLPVWKSGRIAACSPRGKKKTHETARWAPRESCPLNPNPSIPHPTQPTTPSRARFESSRNFLLLFFQSYCCYPERNFLVVFCSIVPLLHRWRTPRSRRRRWCTARRSSRRRSSAPTRRATPSPSPSGPSFASSIPSKEHPRPRLSYRGLFC